MIDNLSREELRNRYHEASDRLFRAKLHGDSYKAFMCRNELYRIRTAIQERDKALSQPHSNTI